VNKKNRNSMDNGLTSWAPAVPATQPLNHSV
jgi:hypothetical protein